MKKVFTIPLVSTLIQWINEKLQGKSDINHSHSNATQNHSGFMSFEDKAKLDNVPASPKYTDTVTTINGKTGVITKTDITALGIPAQDTVYTHPSTHPASIITQDSSRRMVSDAQIAAWNGKANAEHEHEEYLSELPLPLTKIGETDGQMTYDGQVVTGGGGGEPAWGEYGQFKKVMIPEHIINSRSKDEDAFWDFVRDEYGHKPGMYAFVYIYNPGGMMSFDLYSADGIMVTHFFDPESQEWIDLDEMGVGAFPINEIPEDVAEMISELGGFVWDNFEMAGEPIHVWEPPEPFEIVYEAGTLMRFENLTGSGFIVFHTLQRNLAYTSGTEYYRLMINGIDADGRWRRGTGNSMEYYGTPKPEGTY